MLIRLALVYALLVNYALIGMFLIHLTARAYWVALVGVDSVFPAGVRWENHRSGPLSRREMQRQLASIPDLVERADNFSSLCFSFGLFIVMSAMLGAAYALPAAAIALLFNELAFSGQRLDAVFLTVMGCSLAPLVLAPMVDRLGGRFGGIAPGSMLGRAIIAVCRLRINSLPAPLMLMLSSNLRSMRAYRQRQRTTPDRLARGAAMPPARTRPAPRRQADSADRAGLLTRPLQRPARPARDAADRRPCAGPPRGQPATNPACPRSGRCRRPREAGRARPAADHVLALSAAAGCGGTRAAHSAIPVPATVGRP
jgi:hypothetical protein